MSCGTDFFQSDIGFTLKNCTLHKFRFDFQVICGRGTV